VYKNQKPYTQASTVTSIIFIIADFKNRSPLSQQQKSFIQKPMAGRNMTVCGSVTCHAAGIYGVL